MAIKFKKLYVYNDKRQYRIIPAEELNAWVAKGWEPVPYTNSDWLGEIVNAAMTMNVILNIEDMSFRDMLDVAGQLILPHYGTVRAKKAFWTARELRNAIKEYHGLAVN